MFPEKLKFINSFVVIKTQWDFIARRNPRGYFQIKRSGCLDLTSSLEAKFGARLSQVHQIRGKTSPQDAKVGKRSQFEVISEIQRAKFGVLVTFIFRGKIWGSNKNFRSKFWGQAPTIS